LNQKKGEVGGDWRKLRNEEFHNSYFSPSTILMYRAYTKEWCGFKNYYKMYFSPYTGITYTVISGSCSSFSRATNRSLLMLTAKPRDQFPRWRCNRRRRSVCSVLVSRSVITVRREFRVRSKKYIILVWCVLLNRSGHFKTEHIESPPVSRFV
jgi:hypothetical protein